MLHTLRIRTIPWSRGTCWGATLPRKRRLLLKMVLKVRTRLPRLLHHWCSAHRTSREGRTTMLTLRIFLRGSTELLPGVGAVPSCLAHAGATEGRKRKILVVIFQRGAA